MAARTKVGIIGFGMAGRNMHAKALVEGLADIVEVAAVWTRRPVPREGENDGDFPVGETVAMYTDLDAFLAHPGLEAVHVTTPSGLHRDYVVRAARAGKHVVCDKPLEVTLSKADECIAACEENGVRLSVSFQNRYNLHMAKLKRAIEDGVLGRLVSGTVEAKLYRNREYYTESSWHGRLALDGGAALMNQGIHYIDLLQWLMDSTAAEVVKGVAQRVHHTTIEAEDFGYGELRLESGAEMIVLGGTCFKPGLDQRFEIKGEDGWVRVVNGVVTHAFWGGRGRLERFGVVEGVMQSGSSPVQGLENHIRCFRAFYDALHNGGETPVPGSEARKSVEIILGIYKAQETNGPVVFPLDPAYRPSMERP